MRALGQFQIRSGAFAFSGMEQAVRPQKDPAVGGGGTISPLRTSSSLQGGAGGGCLGSRIEPLLCVKHDVDRGEDDQTKCPQKQQPKAGLVPGRSGAVDFLQFTEVSPPTLSFLVDAISGGAVGARRGIEAEQGKPKEPISNAHATSKNALVPGRGYGAIISIKVMDSANAPAEPEITISSSFWRARRPPAT